MWDLAICIFDKVTKRLTRVTEVVRNAALTWVESQSLSRGRRASTQRGSPLARDVGYWSPRRVRTVCAWRGSKTSSRNGVLREGRRRVGCQSHLRGAGALVWA